MTTATVLSRLRAERNSRRGFPVRSTARPDNITPSQTTCEFAQFVIVGGSNDEMRESVSGTKELLTLGAGMSARAALCVLALRAEGTSRPSGQNSSRKRSAAPSPLSPLVASCCSSQLLTGMLAMCISALDPGCVKTLCLM